MFSLLVGIITFLRSYRYLEPPKKEVNQNPSTLLGPQSTGILSRLLEENENNLKPYFLSEDIMKQTVKMPTDSFFYIKDPEYNRSIFKVSKNTKGKINVKQSYSLFF